MNIDKFLLSNTSGEKSLTATLFIVGFIIACFKLLVSGMVIGSFQMGNFSGIDAAAVFGALGLVYKLRRDTEDKAGK